MKEPDSRSGNGRGGGTATLPAPATATVRAPERPLPAARVLAAHALRERGADIRRRLWWRFATATGGAHLAGAIAAFVLLNYVVPIPVAEDAATRRFYLWVFVGFMAVGWSLGAFVSHRMWQPVERWLLSDRPPDAREIELVVRQPLRQALACAWVWVFGALFFAALSFRQSPLLAFEIGALIFDAGIVTCALSYLLVERTLRPVTARALAFGMPGRPGLPDIRARLVWTWMLGTGVVLAWLLTIGAVVLAGAPASRVQLATSMLVLAVLGTVVGWYSIVIAARSVADPIRELRAALARVEEGETDVETPIYDASEVGLLQVGFNRMVAGLRERELLRDLFGRHVGEDVARQALDRGLQLGGETREAAVLFVDLLGSTAMAASRDPAAVLDTLNRFFGIVVDEVSLRGGWVNKFEGDAALCVFGAPTAHPDAAGSALATARALRDRLDRDLLEAKAAIGVSAGKVVAGNVGAAERFEYTVIGDPVNEAARLTELAKEAPGRLLASEAILSRAGASEKVHWRLGDSVTLRGRSTPTRLAEAS